MRFVGTGYRVHDPRWSFKPLSGDGAAIHGGRFNPKGVPALYLSLDLVTAVREGNQGFAGKIEPCVLCSYEVDCDDIIDLLALERKPIPSRQLAVRLIADGRAGILVPSFAVGSAAGSHNLVLWRWGPDLPYRVTVHDPSGRLPRSQLSWD
jgi:RES domain-containing protein